MGCGVSRNLSKVGDYAFDEIDRIVSGLKAQGIRVIDFGVGDPTYPTPELIREATKRGVDAHAASGYPSYVGSPLLRSAIAGWMSRRFGVELDPDREIAVTLGSKEAVFNFPNAVVNAGDVVLVPSPGYPPYVNGTLLAGGVPYFYPVSAEGGFVPVLQEIPEATLRRARILWVCSPHSPTGRVVPPERIAWLVDWCRRRDIVLAFDEAYTEIYYGSPPRSVLEFGREDVVVFQSLSKRSAMTGYRVGFMCGDASLVSMFRKLKTTIDSGVPDFIQAGAVAALSDEEHVAQARADYGRKRALLLSALTSAGLEPVAPEATIYVWQRVPAGMTDVEFARYLLEPQTACAVIPGSWLAWPLANGVNPGSSYVRWSLCPPLEEVEEAVRRLGRRSA